MVLGRRSDLLGRWRWPVGAVGGALIAVFSTTMGDWTVAAVAGALALVAGALAVRSFR